MHKSPRGKQENMERKVDRLAYHRYCESVNFSPGFISL